MPIITPTGTIDILDAAITQDKLADDINISKFVNDAGYLTTGTLGGVNTDAIAEGTLNLYYTDTRVVNVVTNDDFNLDGTWNFTKIVVNPNDYPKPEFALFSGYTGDNAGYYQYTDVLQTMAVRRVTSGTGVTFNTVNGTMYDYDVTGASGSVGGPGFFNTIGDQTNGHRIITATYNGVKGVTTSGNSFDTYYGDYKLVCYEKETGTNELGRNILTFDKNSTQVHNKLTVVNMPLDSGTEFLSKISLAYTGTQDGMAEGSIQLYNATDDSTYVPILFNEGTTTFANFTSFNWLIALAEVDTATLNGIGTQQTGSTAYCNDGDAGSPCLAVYDGTNWRRVSLGAAISTT